ncbi:MAG: UDP-N-acetylmuramoyl-tripeptide--D-alanyl-D-alanine ligase [Leptospira sp.]|nr:UDP-N-acetylmuramoyl-tripeptide--D-alanyl-D-alanine ligase [Leptospira sp.]
MIAPFSYSLSTILAVLNRVYNFSLYVDTAFTSITTSSKESKKGSLFVPLVWDRDGHLYIKDALDRGASGFLCKKDHPILKELSIEEQNKAILVRDTLHALGTLANFHRNRFATYVVAITGSSGKTTTKDLLGSVFSYLPKKQVVVTEKNYNNEIGVPFTLFRITKDTRIAVVEMGMNHRGEIERLSKVANPNATLITNIGSAHIENLKSPKEIANEKLDITKGMVGDRTLFVPDDLNFLNLAKTRAKKEKWKLVTWRQSKSSSLKIVKTNPGGFVLSLYGKDVTWNLPGTKLLSNVRGVIACAEFLNIPKDAIVNAIQKYKSPDKRLNIKKSKYTIIDDSYNANPESMASSIEAAAQMAGKKNLVWVLGDMKELGSFSKHYHREIGKLISRFPNGNLYTYGKDSKEISKVVSGGEHFTDREKLIEHIRTNVSKGSVILIKGSRSMKMEEIAESLYRIKT